MSGASHYHGHPVKSLPNLNRRALIKGIAAAALSPAVGWAGSPAMLTRRIPATGEALPVIGLGTWQALDIGAPADLDSARLTLQGFAGRGGSLIDSSPMYGRCESVLGRLATELELAGKLFLATKVWTSGRDNGILDDGIRARMATILRG